MITLGVVILLFAGFVRAGSSTNASLSERLSPGLGLRAPGGTRSESDEVAYWHRLAAKRLRIIGKREHRIVYLLGRLHDRVHSRSNGVRANRNRGASVRSIICQVFGSQCSKALSVAWCESRFNIYARNGQYLGLFQMGEYARARYGHGWDALTQTRAAHRYYLDAGWSPWSCA